MQQQAQRGDNVPLALVRPETASDGKLSVQSPAFNANGAMMAKYSEYAEGVSPRLSWQAVAGAKSYAVIMEDPDAPNKPFVHWLAWNIPANVTSLPEGLQEQARLTAPEGVLQGRNTRGSIGYFGPKPPVGDPAHHYHFQVFALDIVLPLGWGAERDQLLQAIQGHVLSKGEVIGRYAQTQAPMK